MLFYAYICQYCFAIVKVLLKIVTTTTTTTTTTTISNTNQIKSNNYRTDKKTLEACSVHVP